MEKENDKDKENTKIKSNSVEKTSNTIENTKEVFEKLKIDNKNEIEEKEGKEGKKEKVFSTEQLSKIVLLLKAFSQAKILKTDNLPVSITEEIFIGSFAAAENKEELIKNGITHVLNAAALVKNHYEDLFKYKKIDNLLDTPEANIQQYFNESCLFIEEAIKNGGKVFVHCHAGISRSSTLIIAYMIKNLNYTFEDALAYCKEKRNKINPNSGFQEQLRKYEIELKGKKIEEGKISNENKEEKQKEEN